MKHPTQSGDITAMLKQLKEQLYSRISDHLPERNYFSADVLTGQDIPADVGHFLARALSRRAKLEGSDLFPESSDWFDLDAPPIRAAIQDFVEALSSLARFPADDFDRTLVRAVDICSEYVVRPVDTLAAFVVSDREEDNSHADMRRRAGYFLHYGYLLESFDAYLSGHAGNPVERNALADHLKKADGQRAASLNVDGWIHLLAPMAESCRMAFADGGGIPTELLVEFFRDKKAIKLAEAAATHGKRNNGSVTSQALHNMLRDLLEPKVAPPVEPPQRRAPGSGSGADQSELPLWKQFAKEGQTVKSDTLPRPEVATQAQPLWKTYRPSETSKESVEADVLGVDQKHRDRFVRDLFRGDEGLYAKALKSLLEARDWESASAILSHDVFRPNQVDIYSESAVMFTNAIERRVRQQN